MLTDFNIKNCFLCCSIAVEKNCCKTTMYPTIFETTYLSTLEKVEDPHIGGLSWDQLDQELVFI